MEYVRLLWYGLDHGKVDVRLQRVWNTTLRRLESVRCRVKIGKYWFVHGWHFRLRLCAQLSPEAEKDCAGCTQT